ncbi:hypothetical protein P153DRAFT_293368 [Dothidotthia symphoricarpi CBS 119687]|uniref:MaoC-like domain-containing protein n=1 Tax=Dothidotthia symphoricarpi CBS 119687 TaxID=1392245 RepID=A0A6A6ACG7_9PLEO|nr:uncharacterized protein P153DRAFT_293368 [Dothidotthia symphoricarpi CBS 119687]KAF2128608.1 hypothetical protein P153DRAFT_293368 [Dothidotthia symphoricarpi CBS 119687]
MYTRRVAIHHAHWARTGIRCYAVNTNDAQWFPQLRAEMLTRHVRVSREYLDSSTEHKLIDTLRSHLPAEWCPRFHADAPRMPMGHHLIYFNPSLSGDQLLPDGTDALHDPGAPWVRRMWAGGSMRIRPELYHHKTDGFIMDTFGVCAERIQDVQLRGTGDSAKVFVTIERRFARHDLLSVRYREAARDIADSRARTSHDALAYFRSQQNNDDEWGDALFKEVRNLVFLKKRTADELDAAKTGNMPPIKYLPAPSNPDFSHELTPTRSMLFRFSALTWNDHLIHLDPEYARTVEGHRNMLVHGPLCLTLMLKAITPYIDTHSKGKQCFESIEYRNLAPLYCDEKMRICGMVTKTSATGNQYDVWIEGPTGGVAVSGKVHTVIKPPSPRERRPRLSRATRRSEADKKASRPQRTNPAIQTASDRSSRVML